MARGIAASGLLALGTLLLLVALGVVGRAYLGRWLYDLQMAAGQEALPDRIEVVGARPTSSPIIVPTETPTRTAEPERAHESSGGAGELALATSAADVMPAATPVQHPEDPAAVPSPPLQVGYGHPEWMVIPSIRLKARVMAVGTRGGFYDVPAWDVGWHKDSAPVGAPGNTIFNGHLETIDAGRVFARLRELRPGDLVYVDTEGYRTTWVVDSTERVLNDERGFIGPTDDVRLTLYTCEGRFNWSTRQYSHFRVVTARFVEATERS